MSKSSEDMNSALSAVGLCWCKGDPVICSAADPNADPDARNDKTLLSYVVTCRYKGVAYSELASAVKDKFEGDRSVLDAIQALPNV